MLVLTRKQGEEIYIGDAIKVKVVSVTGKRVKLGFECPREIPIQRSELERELCDVGAGSEFDWEFSLT